MSFPESNSLLEPQRLLRVAASEISDGGHARGEILQPVVVGRVDVHVPQTRQERLAADVDHLRAARNGDAAACADSSDPVARDDHRRVRANRAGLGVEQVRVGEHRGTRRDADHLLREIDTASRIVFRLRGQQRRPCRFEAPPNGHEPTATRREERAAFVRPPRGWREPEAVHGVQRHLLR